MNDVGLKLPIELPFSINKTENGNIEVNIVNGFSLPVSIPFSLNTTEEVTPGLTTVQGFSLPFSIPFSLSTIEETTSDGRIKKSNKVHVKEKAWKFKGLIFQETIVTKMTKSLVLKETTKSRILVNVYLIDRNNIRIEWYGGNVPELQVMRKLSVDDKYDVVGDPIPWDQGYTNVNISDDSYNIYLKSTGDEGESGIINIGDNFYTEIKNALTIALNRKLYYIKVNFESAFKIKVDF